MLRLAVAAVAAAAAAQPPAWISRAVPPPIVAWVEADVLGTPIPEGIAVSGAGGRCFVGVADSRLDPPEMVLEYDLADVGKGRSVVWLHAGHLTGTAAKEIGVDLRLGGAERVWILRVDHGRLRLLRRFDAPRIRLVGTAVRLDWPGRHEVWRFERGAYRR